MSTPQEINELSAELDAIKVSTEAGTLEWVKANPATFVWARPLPPARMTLQRIETPPTAVVMLRGQPTVVHRGKRFVLQAYDAANLRLSIDGGESEELNQKMEQLFDVIMSVQSRKGIEFLKSILPK